jgi:hypothetical protein
MDWMTERSRFDPQQRKRILPLISEYRPAGKATCKNASNKNIGDSVKIKTFQEKLLQNKKQSK